MNLKHPKHIFLGLMLSCIGCFWVSLSVADDAPAESTESAISKPQKSLSGVQLSDPKMAGNLLQTTLGLLLVLMLIGVAAWAFKRFANVQIGAHGRMKVVGGISLGTRERAVLLQVGEQQLLLGVSPGRVQTLHVLEEPLTVDNEQANSQGFSARLQAAIMHRKAGVNEAGRK